MVHLILHNSSVWTFSNYKYCFPVQRKISTLLKSKAGFHAERNDLLNWYVMWDFEYIM